MKASRNSVIGVIFIVLMANVPMIALAESMTFPRSSDFGIHAEVNSLLEEIAERRTSPEILKNTEAVLDVIEEEKIEKEYIVDANQDIRQVEFERPPRNDMVDSLLGTEGAGYSSLWDFLLNNPLQYYVYVNYTADDEDGYWLEASAIDPTNVFEPDWTHIDIDNDPATGDASGDDVRVRFKIEPRRIVINELGLIPPSINFEMFGGVAFQVEDLTPDDDTDDTVPVELGVAKWIPFDGKNYAVMLKFMFEEDICDHYSLNLLMNFYLSDLTVNVVTDLITGNWENIEMDLDESVDGPYIIEWGPMTTYFDLVLPDDSLIRTALDALGFNFLPPGRYDPENMPNLDIMAGIGNVTEDEFGNYVWKEISWLSTHAEPLPGDEDDDGLLPGLGNLTLDTRSEDTAFDAITWFYPENNSTYGFPCDIDIIYEDARDNESFYANMSIESMPYWFQLRLENLTEEDNPDHLLSRLSLDSTTRVKKMVYTEYLYELDRGNHPQLPPHRNDPYRVMHIDMWDIPTNFTLTGTFNSGSAPTALVATGDMITAVFSAVIGYFYKGFWGVGNTLRSMSDRMFNMPSEKGWFKLRINDIRPIGGVEFWYTSDRYVYLTKKDKNDNPRDFVAFTRDRGDMVDTPISGRIRDIGDTKLFFGNNTAIDLEIEGNRAFYFTFVDQEAWWPGHGYNQENATLCIENIPSDINITVTDNSLSINSTGGDVGNVSFIGVINGTYMMLKLKGFPNGLDLYNHKNLMVLNFTSALDSLELIISDGDCYRLPGSHVMLRQTKQNTVISAKITDIKQVTYDTRGGTRFAYELESTYPLYVLVNDTKNKRHIKAAVDPLPISIDLSLSAGLNTDSIEVPSMGDIGSVFDLSNVLVSVATMGDTVTNMLSNVTQGGLDILKDIGSNDNFNYASSFNLNIVAEIKIGDTSILGPVEWTHGVSMKSVEVDDGPEKKTVMWAKLYLNGMPKMLDVFSALGNDTIGISIDVKRFTSDFPWILLDIEGLDGRDIFVYLSGLKNNSGLHLDLNMSSELNAAVPTIQGQLEFSMNRSIEAIYAVIGGSKGQSNVMTVYALKPPMTGTFAFDVTHETHLKFDGSSGIQHLMLDIAKEIDSKWYNTHLLVTDMPRSVGVDVWANPEYDMDDPNPLQGLPTVEIRVSEPGMSAHVHMDGRNIGQQGDLDLYMTDIGKDVSLGIEDEELVVKGDLRTLMLRYSDLPVRKELQIETLEIYAKDVRELKINIRMTMGALPIISVDATESGDLRISLKGNLDLMGRKPGKIVFIDMPHNGLVPGVGTMGMNDISLEGGKEHLLVPDAVSTLVLTALG